MARSPSNRPAGWLSAATLASAALASAALGCGPSLMDEPTDYVGGPEVAVATLCGDSSVATDDEFWVKYAVLRQPAAVVDWSTETLAVQGATVVRRAAGRETEQPSGHFRRIETFWLRPNPGAAPGGTLSIGPMEARYSAGGQITRILSSKLCTVKIKD
jgi:hypothetical protein